MNKTTLLLVPLGSILLSILLPITLLSNTNSTLNKNTSSSIGLVDISKIEKKFTQADADLLIASKGLNWDGNLVANDFIGYTSIGDYAFKNNRELKSVTLSDTIKTIGVFSFASSSLTSINLSKTTSIGNSTFEGSTSLTTIDALGITSIGANAFTGTTGIIVGGIKLTYSIEINNNKTIYWGTTIDKLDIINHAMPLKNLGVILGVFGAFIGFKLLLIILTISISFYNPKKTRASVKSKTEE